MYLKRLEIQGFKSFANKTTLEFERGMTAVVGPNGSGKSNIADAIRWVLGEQSSKQLRGKKSEDVIFAGSEKKTKHSFAEVSVTFDNEDRKIPLDAAEVSITRQIDRSGESDYLINGNKVRLLDVVDLILKSNIGTSRYTVIGQGTIDQMILSGPSEVKNLIDEASGVKTYYMRRDKTLKRLETTAQNLIRVQDLIAEIEPRLKSLRRQAKRMQERTAIEEELKTYQSTFYAHKYWQIKSAIGLYVGQLEVFSSERARIETELSSYRKNLDTNSENSRHEVEEYQRIQTEIKKLTEKKNKLIEDVSMIRGKLEAQKNVGNGSGVTDRKALELELRNLEHAKAAFESDLQVIEQSKEQIKERTRHTADLFTEITKKLGSIQTILDTPENLSFDELREDVAALELQFGQFYDSLEIASSVDAVRQHADRFRTSFHIFKQRALELAQNPFSNFEKQKKSLSDILSQKDVITQEMNRLDLEQSKANIQYEYQTKELEKTEKRMLQVRLELRESSSENKDEYFNTLLAEEQKLQNDITGVVREIAELDVSITEYHAHEEKRKAQLFEEERLYRIKQDGMSRLRDSESLILVEKAKLDTQMENIVSEIIVALGDTGLQSISSNNSNTPVDSQVEEKIIRLKHQLELIGGIDELTLKEYDETETRYGYLTTQVNDLNHAMADLRQVIEELDGYIKKQFNASFKDIDEKFQNYFRILFNGGRAYLSLVYSGNQTESDENANGIETDTQSTIGSIRLEEQIVAQYEQSASTISGIDIKATPPGKKLTSISALSGGERALTSIALLCALLSCFPSPFVVLDEVDAALDEANTIRFAEILGTLATYTQFITVSHNRETMRKAHTLYGVTMGDDSISKILSLKIDQAQVYAK